MNYAEMSDDKINLQVFECLFGSIGEDRDMLRIWQQGKFQPCNSWADAGPIIEANEISLNSVYEGGPCWLSVAGDDGELGHTDTNPLRAAMIVFLMMQENPDA